MVSKIEKGFLYPSKPLELNSHAGPVPLLFFFLSPQQCAAHLSLAAAQDRHLLPPRFKNKETETKFPHHRVLHGDHSESQPKSELKFD
jgi:hypothetical protein